MTWKRATADGLYRCGRCAKAIAKGALVAFTRHGAARCEDCGRQFEEPPGAIEDSEVSGVPSGVRHQPSLGFDRGAR